MQVHKTKGIVLRTVKYGESSVISTVYTELFGMQSYIVKGVRQSSKKSQGKANYFQPSAILEMTVYHNELKHLQFIKEYQWAYLYNNVLFDVVKNTVAQYIVELLQHTLKQPEANPELYYLTEQTLVQLDTAENAVMINLPLYYTLHVGSQMGFQIQGNYSSVTPILDLAEGTFTASLPQHAYYIDNDLAKNIAILLSMENYAALANIQLTRQERLAVLDALQLYMKLHVIDFGEMRSIAILQEIFN